MTTLCDNFQQRNISDSLARVQGCFKKVWKLCEVLNVRVTAGACQGTGEASWVGALFPFLPGVTEILCKIKSNFLNPRVLAGGFVMGCAKMSWF